MPEGRDATVRAVPALTRAAAASPVAIVALVAVTPLPQKCVVRTLVRKVVSVGGSSVSSVSPPHTGCSAGIEGAVAQVAAPSRVPAHDEVAA